MNGIIFARNIRIIAHNVLDLLTELVPCRCNPINYCVRIRGDNFNGTSLSHIEGYLVALANYLHCWQFACVTDSKFIKYVLIIELHINNA